MTSQGCAPSPASITTGPVDFNVNNGGTGAVTEAELRTKDLAHILGEQENLTPGLSGGFALTLDPGTYVVSCPGADQEHWALTVTGHSGAAAVASSPALKTATAGYARYVDHNVAGLVAHTKAFCQAIDARDLVRGAGAYPQARVYYERIEPVAEIWGSLDTSIDGRWKNPVTVKSQFVGFHRLEQLLWADDTLVAGRRCAQVWCGTSSSCNFGVEGAIHPVEAGEWRDRSHQRSRDVEDQWRGGALLRYRLRRVCGERRGGAVGRGVADSVPQDGSRGGAGPDRGSASGGDVDARDLSADSGLRRHRVRRLRHRSRRRPAVVVRRGQCVRRGAVGTLGRSERQAERGSRGIAQIRLRRSCPPETGSCPGGRCSAGSVPSGWEPLPGRCPARGIASPTHRRRRRTRTRSWRSTAPIRPASSRQPGPAGLRHAQRRCRGRSRRRARHAAVVDRAAYG